ncbi:tyrosine-type recombinase/integrase [Alloalcanivorax xenomutans]
MPEYVYRIISKNRVIWRRYAGQGRFERSITLTDDRGKPLPSNASHKSILEAYHRQVATGSHESLEWLLREHMKAPRVRPIKDRTRENYERYVDAICSAPMASGKTLGQVSYRKANRRLFVRYRDRLKDTPVAANRHLQFLSAAFSWAIEREYLTENPCKGIRKYSTPGRTRYVEDCEFDLVQSLAPDYIAIAMEFAYLMRARRGEILALRREDVDERGIFLRRTKASESEVTLWSDRLRQAYDAALALHKGVISPWILHRADGTAIEPEAFSTAWGRAMDKALEGDLKERFTFHDLKAKGLTDDTEHWAGHKSERMRQVYQRLAREKKATR